MQAYLALPATYLAAALGALYCAAPTAVAGF